MTLEGLKGILDESVGAIFSFLSADDPHSPVHQLACNEVRQSLPSVPWFTYDVAWISDEVKEHCILYSVPTTVWLHPDGQPIARVVGSVNTKKLELELNKAVDQL